MKLCTQSCTAPVPGPLTSRFSNLAPIHLLHTYNMTLIVSTQRGPKNKMSTSIQIKFGTHNLPWEDICNIFKLAPLGEREPEKLKRASENSYLVCTAWNQMKVRGFARIISDQEYQAAIYDLVVLPDYEGKGIGRQIMEAITNKLPSLWSTILFAVPEKVPFYRKLGYKRLKTGMGVFSNTESAKANGLIE